MNKKLRAGIVGATGMVGQRFVTMLADHPWFEITALAASARSAGMTYKQAVDGRWAMNTPLPCEIGDMAVLDAAEIDAVCDSCDFVFCAISLDKKETMALEEAYARRETPVISNNSAHRLTPDAPMMLPEINAHHAELIMAQRERLGTKRGFIAVKPNCSIQSYVPALHPLRGFGIKQVAVCTYQAISGAGKTFETMPEMIDNIIPYIGGEEEKSEIEPLRIWGDVNGGAVEFAKSPAISAQCVRVPVTDGHMAAVFVSFERKPSEDEMLRAWAGFKGYPQHNNLPSAPKLFIHYFTEADRPQTRLDRDIENGMAVSVGRLREDSIFDYKFVSLSHNTLRGAAGGAVLMAETLYNMGYIEAK